MIAQSADLWEPWQHSPNENTNEIGNELPIFGDQTRLMATDLKI